MIFAAWKGLLAKRKNSVALLTEATVSSERKMGTDNIFKDRMRGMSKEERALRSIRKCIIKGGCDVVFVRSKEPCMLVASEKQDAIARIITTIEGDALFIEQEGSSLFGNNSITVVGGSVYVNGSRVTDAEGAKIGINRSRAVIGIAMPEAPEIHVNGSADIELEDVNQANLNLFVSGSGDIHVSGAVDTLIANISGSGDIDAEGLLAQCARLTVAGSGGIKANVANSAQARVSGSGSIKVQGNPPNRDQLVTGSGKIKFK